MSLSQQKRQTRPWHETLLMRMRRLASDERRCLQANETKEIKKGFNRKSKLIYGKDFRFRGPENDSKFINERRSNQDCVSQRWPLRQFGEKVVRPVKSVNISAMHGFNPVRSSKQTLICTCSRLSNRFWDIPTASLALGTIRSHIWSASM